ncbi:hypothetical protein [Streptomyces sp. Iso 434]|uniref:hypothetical protein n=1 Tax=Streptomyces sp. Iso 434 TaxID=3062272 RepID=UPI00397F66A0
MAWKREFEGELRAIRKSLEPPTLEPLKRLDDPTVGLAALYEAVTHGRMKVLEQVQGGVTGLREENREVRRRQDRMISDLHGFREEVRELAELLPLLRDLAGRGWAPSPEGGSEEEAGIVAQGGEEGEGQPSASVDARHQVAPASAFQGDSVENVSDGERVESDPDGLKAKAESVYLDEGRADETGPSASVSGSGAAESSAARPEVEHGVLLLRAAGVASADIVAHRDTWEWLADLAAGHEHFRNPSAVEDIKDGRVQTSLSGRSLIAVLIKTWETRAAAPMNTGDWAMAAAVYRRVAAKLTALTGEGEVIRVVLDDGASG